MNRLIKDTAYYSIGSFTAKALNFIFLPIYLNYLSPSDYGIVSSMQVFGGILLIFLTFGLERSIYRLIYDYKTETEKRNFLGTISISVFFLALFICSILFIGNSLVGQIFKNISFYPYFAYAICTAFFSCFELVPLIALQVKQRAKLYLKYSLILLVIKVFPVLFFVVYQQEGAVGMLKGGTAGGLLGALIIIPLTLKQINLKFNKKILRDVLIFCLPLVPLVISSWVVNMSDRIFIERLYGTYDVGIYSLGYKIGQLVQFLSVAVLMAYNPYFYKIANLEDQVGSKNKLVKANNYIVLFVLCISFLIAFFSKEIITWFFDNSYLAVIRIIPLIALGGFFMQLVSLQNLSFYQEKKTFQIMTINIVAACFNIVLNYFLILTYGYLGAAWATVITQFLLFLLIYKYAKKYFYIPYNWIQILPIMIIFTLIVILNHIYIPVGFLTSSIKFICVLLVLLYLMYKNKNYLTVYFTNK
ncbi:oligosaccharide flippase family protein [Leeuwenhoekiella aequorea]|uniref:lipopolysaccharide biosynthesis protein n=1 Tax=Leeuwenhoekiella aequorea TaxID=283736 RepID=UPI00352D7D95